MSLDSFGLANSGSLVQRSQNPRTVTSRARAFPRRSLALKRACLASVFVAYVPGPPSTPDTLTFFPVAGS
jgi:hypothetical protein